MSLKLPRFDRNIPITEGDFPSQSYHIWWQKVVETVEETVNNIRRVMSHTAPTTILRAVDDGTDCTVTVLDHTRVYADGTTVAITGISQSGLLPETWYAAYYDDSTMSDETPTFTFTTNLAEAHASEGPNRHYCGRILTPAAGSGDIVETGGVVPPGSSSIGAEIS